MRYVVTVVLAAILLFLTWMLVAGIASYFGGHLVPDSAVPDSWSPPDSWAEWRDIVIVLSGFWWELAGFFMVALLAALLVVALLIRRVIKENAVPAIDSLRESLDNLRGTTEFAGETVASPIIRTYSVVKGVRSGIGAITNLPDRIRGRRGKR